LRVTANIGIEDLLERIDSGDAVDAEFVDVTPED